MSENLYRQCDLARGTMRQTAWLPIAFAKHRKYLKLLDQDGWQVTKVYDDALPEAIVAVSRSEHRDHRKVTDI
jgi:hypothetical protein